MKQWTESVLGNANQYEGYEKTVRSTQVSIFTVAKPVKSQREDGVDETLFENPNLVGSVYGDVCQVETEE